MHLADNFWFARDPSRIDAKRGDHILQADFPLLIVVSERKITSEWPTICPEPWSSFPRTPFERSRPAADATREVNEAVVA
jgi:hypothetical protein